MKVTINVVRNDLLADLTGNDNAEFFARVSEMYGSVLKDANCLPETVDETEISLAILTASEMEDVNFEFRELREPTDVLSFPLWEEEAKFEPPSDWNPLPLGDIAICPMIIRDNAAASGKTFAQELALVLLHGFLHLIGWDHDTQEKEDSMWAEQERVLAAFDF